MSKRSKLKAVKKILINIVLVTIVLLSGFHLSLIVGNTVSIKLLFICITLDYILGNSLALAKISKHGNGEISSQIGLIGLIKKIAILFITIVSIYVDKLFLEQSLNIAISNIIIISFIINEIISIFENAKIVHVNIPKFVKDKLEEYQDNLNNENINKEEKKTNDKNN